MVPPLKLLSLIGKLSFARKGSPGRSTLPAAPHLPEHDRAMPPSSPPSRNPGTGRYRMVCRLSTNMEWYGPLSQPRKRDGPRPPALHRCLRDTRLRSLLSGQLHGSTTYGNHASYASRTSGKSWQLPSLGVTSGPDNASNSSMRTKPWSPRGSTSRHGIPPCLIYYATSSCMLHSTITLHHFNTCLATPTA